MIRWRRSESARDGLTHALLWGLLLLLVLSPGAAAAKKKEEKKAPAAEAKGSESAEAMPDTWYVSTLSESEAGVLGVHYWSKGASFRAETIVEGHRFATIVNGDSYYIVDVVSGSGVAIERSAKAVAEDAGRGRPFGREWEELIRDGGEKVRSRELGGAAYDVYRITDDAGRREVIVTQSEPRIPVRVETFNRKSGKTGVVSYMHWMRGLVIADAFFEPPPGLELARIDYEEYLERIRKRPAGPAPVLYDNLLHGEQER
jgi:outer membrane lipoprotein-sorting protein